MQTTIIRDLALTVAANSLIAGKRVRRFRGSDPILQFSDGCVFIDEANVMVADDPNAWLERMRGFDGLWLHYARSDRSIPDRLSVAFAGGGARWIIQAMRGETSELWEGNDAVGDAKAAGGRVWNSGYVRIAADWRELPPPGVSLRAVMAELDATLEQIAAFAHEQDRQNFAASFDAAHAALKGRPRRDPMFLHGELSDEAAQLWSAVGSAWVFGGMGSWNDIGFERDADRARYEQLSETLCGQLNGAVAAVANSTWPKYRMPSKEGTTWWQRLFMKLPPEAP